jgi:hypothetical protein
MPWLRLLPSSFLSMPGFCTGAPTIELVMDDAIISGDILPLLVVVYYTPGKMNLLFCKGGASFKGLWFAP